LLVTHKEGDVMPRSSDVVVALSLAFAGIAAGYALYSYLAPVDAGRVSTSSVPQNTVAQPESLVMQTEPVAEPLRVANPFDATETFEFPAGTSEADAREAIAGFLIERAARRGVAGDRRAAGSRG
jgi:hypothetical protein